MKAVRSALLGTASALALSLALVAIPARAHDGMGAASAAPLPAGVSDIVRDPTDLPPEIGKRAPEHVRIDLEAVELEGRLDNGATYKYWTFNGKVPGPFLRVRVGDTVEIHLKNSPDSQMMHSIDLHAVTGPGGGAQATEVAPGEERSFTFKALTPGLYIYHCATMMHAMHISNGMYGLILVEPEAGLPKVDHEFYIVQGELYTEQKIGAKGEFTQDYDKLVDERPTIFTFNGAVKALTGVHEMKARVGDRVRIYVGDAGPNFTSSFHMIGSVFDKAYAFGDMVSPPLRDVQTLTIPPGGAAAVEVKLRVPGDYTVLDHAISRLEKGLVGVLHVDGPADPSVFNPGPGPKTADAR